MFCRAWVCLGRAMRSSLIFGAEPNERNNAPLVECGKAFCHYVDLHLQMLHKVIASDEWYADRFRIDSDGPADEASKSEKV